MLPGTSVGSRSMPSMGETSGTASILPRYSEYRLTQENFLKTVKAQKNFKRQLNAWGKEFKPFVDRIIVEALKAYKNLHSRMDDMEERVNNWLQKLSIPDFAKFVVEFKQAQADIADLKEQPLSTVFDLALVISDKEEGLINLMGRKLKEKGKNIDESGDTRLEKRKDIMMKHQKKYN